MKMLIAGPLRVGYEDGFLRRISYGDSEIVRMIYFALRDHNWNTIPGVITNEVIFSNEHTFSISFEYTNEASKPLVVWKADIRGFEDGTITFEINGLAKEAFRKNRAGFCVLHPLGVAGSVCSLKHPDGTTSTAGFPVAVAPENPFLNISEMSWQSAGANYTIIFEGDTFETEDQRNWGDASYKTFCTPLAKPFPVELVPGDKIFQRITFRPATRLRPLPPAAEFISLARTGSVFTLPRIGVGASTDVGMTAEAAAVLRPLRFSHYRIDAFPGQDNWVSSLSAEYEIAFDLGIPLEVVLHLTANFNEEIDAFIVLCQQNRIRLRKVLLLSDGAMATVQAVVAQAPRIREALPRVHVGAGTNHNFNELNKNRFNGTGLDFISFAVDPQEHAVDDVTIMENSSALESLAGSVRAIYGEGMAAHISPLALRRRYNPYATEPADFYLPDALKADPRQKLAFAAAWALASVFSLAKGSASAVTMFQTVGDQGIVAPDGAPYPVLTAMEGITRYQGKTAELIRSSDPLKVEAMVLDEKVLAVANVSDAAQTVRWQEHDIRLAPYEVQFRGLDRAE